MNVKKFFKKSNDRAKGYYKAPAFTSSSLPHFEGGRRFEKLYFCKDNSTASSSVKLLPSTSPVLNSRTNIEHDSCYWLGSIWFYKNAGPQKPVWRPKSVSVLTYLNVNHECYFSLWCKWYMRYSFLLFQSWRELINLLPFLQAPVHVLEIFWLCYNLFLVENLLQFLSVRSLAACHILECRSGMAQDVISTIGQAFELRFKQYLKNPSLNTSCERSAKSSIIIWLAIFILLYFQIHIAFSNWPMKLVFFFLKNRQFWYKLIITFSIFLPLIFVQTFPLALYQN